jgi:hypothetical protein
VEWNCVCKEIITHSICLWDASSLVLLFENTKSLGETMKHLSLFSRFLIQLFDDIVFDDIGAWSQICKDCLDKYPQLKDQKDITIEDHGSGICGVKGCECDETTYITFERGAE